jgi:hypothetical protein
MGSFRVGFESRTLRIEAEGDLSITSICALHNKSQGVPVALQHFARHRVMGASVHLIKMNPFHRVAIVR